MSLINDALRRAKAVQQSNPPPPDPNLEFRPVEPDRNPRSPLLLWAAGGAVVCAIGVLFLMLRSNEPVAAKPIASPQAAAPVTPAVVEPVTSVAEVATNTPPAESTNEVAAVAEPAPAPVPRLQAILFNPARPSAVVNGKTVFIGNTVANFRVTSITETTVTLVGETESHILTLE
ncbi:MAG TPA: hypothetical protein GYA07_01010 [Verrucomicrobia bacterium]|nr:hypothetical protein [Verrucomicrobiota bacterium]HOB31444.1 hypothetical protein [Verrucomicrobiota bacterium]HOP96762.1 hypothetical protein [Verrucomicrobiota bacterium]